MNLYRVHGFDDCSCCFVFDTSRGRAKARVASYFNCEYINMRCQILAHGVNVPFLMVVDSPDAVGYEYVLKCGYRYATDEELEEMGIF